MTDITKSDLEEMWEKMKDYDFNTDNYIIAPKGSPVTIQAEEYHKLKALEAVVIILEDDEEPREGDWVEIGGYDAIAPSTWQVFEPKDWDYFRERYGYVRILIRDGKPCIYRSKLEKEKIMTDIIEEMARVIAAHRGSLHNRQAYLDGSRKPGPPCYSLAQQIHNLLKGVK